MPVVSEDMLGKTSPILELIANIANAEFFIVVSTSPRIRIDDILRDRIVETHLAVDIQYALQVIIFGRRLN